MASRDFPRSVLVTGGCGFIGSAFLLNLVPRIPHTQFVNLDVLGYAANPLSVAELEACPNYRFVHADLNDGPQIERLVNEFRPDWVVHFAAESHVDRSIRDPLAFARTNIVGTLNLLEACRTIWPDPEGHCFHHVSTDEVFGSLDEDGHFREDTPYDPSSPYSASKAASDHFVRAYGRTFGLPYRLTNCSNNYGPRQFPEKLIPLMILNALDGKPLPVYGTGLNVRDWLYVDDHVEAIARVLTDGTDGETYCIGGNSERTNLDVVRSILRAVAGETGQDPDALEGLIQYVTDRPGHDHRYAIDAGKIQRELGWSPRESFESGLAKTVRWYLENPAWIESVRTGAYREWLDRQYGTQAGGSR